MKLMMKSVLFLALKMVLYLLLLKQWLLEVLIHIVGLFIVENVNVITRAVKCCLHLLGNRDCFGFIFIFIFYH